MQKIFPTNRKAKYNNMQIYHKKSSSLFKKNMMLGLRLKKHTFCQPLFEIFLYVRVEAL